MYNNLFTVEIKIEVFWTCYNVSKADSPGDEKIFSLSYYVKNRGRRELGTIKWNRDTDSEIGRGI